MAAGKKENAGRQLEPVKGRQQQLTQSTTEDENVKTTKGRPTVTANRAIKGQHRRKINTEKMQTSSLLFGGQYL